jgi:AcrR family transcriptional regulator
MGQVKKEAVRDAILDAARTLFVANGYAAATMADIARRAKMATSNIYVYFPSKLAIVYAVAEPWIRAHFAGLERDLANVGDAAERIRRILISLFEELPARDNGFANILMQAISLATAAEYRRDLLAWAEARTAALIVQSLPPKRRALVRSDDVAHLVLMAFDGFALNQKFADPAPSSRPVIDLLTALLIGARPGAQRLAFTAS